MEPGSREWQQANNVRPNGRGGWVSNVHRGDGSFLRQGLLPLAGVLGGGLAAQALLPAAAAGGGTSLTSAGLGTLPSYGASPAMYAAGAGLPSAAAGSGLLAAGGGGTSLLGRILTGLRNYAPLGIAGAGAIRGLTQGPTDAERQLQEILGLARSRVEASEPLFHDLNALAGEDAGRMRGRQASSDALYQALSAMAGAQLPAYAKKG